MTRTNMSSEWLRGVFIALLVIALAAGALTLTPPAVSGASADEQTSQVHDRQDAVRFLTQAYPEAVIADRHGAIEERVGDDIPSVLDQVVDFTRPESQVQALSVLLQRQGYSVAVNDAPARQAPGEREFMTLGQTPTPPPATVTASPQPSMSPSDRPVLEPIYVDPGISEVPMGPETPTGGFGLGALAGDIDADGLDDFVELDVHDGAGRLQGRRGIDGGTLWRVPVALGAGRVGAAVQPVGDVDGDGSGDVILSVQNFAPNEDEPCLESSCEYGESFVWAISLRSGADGTTVWEQTYEGSSLYIESYGFPEFESSRTTTNAIVPYLPLGDINGSGVGDFLMTRTTESTEDSRRIEGSYPDDVTETTIRDSEASTVVQIIEGSDHSLITEIADEDVTTVLSAEVVGGDEQSVTPAAAVLLTRRELGRNEQVCVISGAERSCTEEGVLGGVEVVRATLPDLATAWTTNFPLSYGGVGDAGDLTGDGNADVLVNAYTVGQEQLVAVVDGADGSTVWADADADHGYQPNLLAVTPLQDDEALDLIEVSYREDRGVIETVIVRRDGATGDVLLQTSAPDSTGGEDDVYSYSAVSPVGDGDGDGSTDVLIYTETYGPDFSTISTVIESGRTGEQLAAFRSENAQQLLVIAAGDLDGDGRDDALLNTYEFNPDGVSGEVLAAVRLIDGAELWRQQQPLASYITGAQPATLTPGPGTDILVNRQVYAIGYRNETEAIDGADGTTLWVSPPPPEVTRAAGSERIGTAVAISQQVYDTADVAVIARADRFPDALAGGPLASALGGPLLLTYGGGLSAATAAELTRLGATRAVLLGGDDALSPQVVADLQSAGLSAERVFGPDRVATAAAVADRVAAASSEPFERVAVAAGGTGDSQDGWTDAILASAYATGTGVPLVLVNASDLPEPASAVLSRLAPSVEVVLVGDGQAIIADTEQQIRDLLDIETVRLARETPAQTSGHVANFAIAHGASPGSMWVATDTAFPDALAASAAVGATNGILLLDGSEDYGLDPALNTIYRYYGAIDEITIVGGANAVPETSAEALATAVGAGM